MSDTKNVNLKLNEVEKTAKDFIDNQKFDPITTKNKKQEDLQKVEKLTNEAIASSAKTSTEKEANNARIEAINANIASILATEKVIQMSSKAEKDKKSSQTETTPKFVAKNIQPETAKVATPIEVKIEVKKPTAKSFDEVKVLKMKPVPAKVVKPVQITKSAETKKEVAPVKVSKPVEIKKVEKRPESVEHKVESKPVQSSKWSNGIIAYKVIVLVPIAIGKKIDGEIFYKVPDLGSELMIEQANTIFKMYNDNMWSEARIENFVSAIRLLEDMEKRQIIRISATNVGGAWLEGKVVVEEQKDKTSWKTQRVVIA